VKVRASCLLREIAGKHDSHPVDQVVLGEVESVTARLAGQELDPFELRQLEHVLDEGNGVSRRKPPETATSWHPSPRGQHSPAP
jgi:hypothetical protein